MNALSLPARALRHAASRTLCAAMLLALAMLATAGGAHAAEPAMELPLESTMLLEEEASLPEERTIYGNRVSGAFGTRNPFNTITVTGQVRMDSGGTWAITWNMHGGSTSSFHSYVVQYIDRKPGGARILRDCTDRSLSCVSLNATGRTLRHAVEVRFCGDRKDDGVGMKCTAFSKVQNF